MGNFKRIAITLYLLTFIMLNLGCSKGSFFPKADVVLSTENANIIPTSDVVTEIEESTVKVTLLNQVTCTANTCTYTYETDLGEVIPLIFTDYVEKRIEAAESGSAEDSFTIRPYRQEIIDLFKNTTSNLNIIKVTVTVHFHDVNGNDFDKSIHFNCFKLTS